MLASIFTACSLTRLAVHHCPLRLPGERKRFTTNRLVFLFFLFFCLHPFCFPSLVQIFSLLILFTFEILTSKTGKLFAFHRKIDQKTCFLKVYFCVSSSTQKGPRTKKNDELAIYAIHKNWLYNKYSFIIC